MRAWVVGGLAWAVGCGQVAGLGDERTHGGGAGSAGSAGSAGGAGTGGADADAAIDDGRIWCQPGGPVEWVRVFGDASDDLAYAIAPDGEGGVYVAGLFSGQLDFGGTPLVSAGGADMFIARLDATGAHVWSKRLGDVGEQQSTGIEIARTPDGFVIAGMFTGQIDFGGGTRIASLAEPFVARYDASGNHQWSRTFDGSNMQSHYGVSSVVVDAAGGSIWLTMTFTESLKVGSETFTSAGHKDGLFVRLDASGAVTHTAQFGGAGDDAANALALTSDGRILLGGVSSGVETSFGMTPLSSTSAGYDAIVGFYQSSGQALWTKRWGDSGNVDVREVAVHSDSGDLLFTGSLRYSEHGVPSANFGGGDITAPYVGAVLVRLNDAAGHVASVALPNFEQQTAIGVDGDGEILLAGGFSQVVDVGTKIASNGFQDGLIVKHAPDLKPIWAVQLGSIEDDAIHGLSIGPAGEAFALGHFRDSAELTGCGTLVSAGGTDLVLLALAP